MSSELKKNGAFVGAELLLHRHPVLSLGLALLLPAPTTVVTHRLSGTDAAWIRPPS